MAKVIIEVIVDSKYGGSFQSFDAKEVHLGRSFENDVILKDPYISKTHLAIFTDGEKLKIKDLNSQNGIYLPGPKKSVTECEVDSGDEIIIGRTRIRLYQAGHEVAPAKTLRTSNKFFRMIEKPIVAWPIFLIVIGLSVLDTYQYTTTNEQVTKLLFIPVSTLFLVLLWAMFWSFIGRIICHKFLFSVHISILSLWIILDKIVNIFNDYLCYYLNGELLKICVDYIMYSILTILALTITLAFSSNMSVKARTIGSSIFTLLLVLITISMRFVTEKEYGIGSTYNFLLKPPVLGIPAAHPIDQFVKRADKLFIFEK